MGIKRCCECGKDKPISEFYVRKAGKNFPSVILSLCKPCNTLVRFRQKWRKKFAVEGAQPLLDQMASLDEKIVEMHAQYKMIRMIYDMGQEEARKDYRTKENRPDRKKRKKRPD